MIYHLNVNTRQFNAIKSGKQKCLIYKSDRDFLAGDELELEEFIACEKCRGTGRKILVLSVKDLGGMKAQKMECCSFPYGKYTGEKLYCKVTHTIGNEFGLVRDSVVMSIQVIP